jgi:hypothetical protein
MKTKMKMNNRNEKKKNEREKRLGGFPGEAGNRKKFVTEGTLERMEWI